MENKLQIYFPNSKIIRSFVLEFANKILYSNIQTIISHENFSH